MASGEAAIRVAEVMHSLLKWLRSIVVQYLWTCKLHCRLIIVGQNERTRRSRHDLENNCKETPSQQRKEQGNERR